MKTKNIVFAIGILGAAISNGFSQAPVITSQPQGLTNFAYTTAVFSVGATGAPPLFYQWRLNNVIQPEATNATLVLTNVQTSHQGNYLVIVTNIEGAATSEVARLRLILPPSITTQLAEFPVVSPGASVSNRIMVTGSPPFSYQWRRDATNTLAGRTTATLLVTNLQLLDQGEYTVVITNVAGSVTSRVARLSMDPTFTKINTGSIVTDSVYGFSCAWGDYDNDGFVDLIMTTLSESAPVRQKNILYHNNRDGSFTKNTNTLITAEGRDWRGCTWADYDNDGYLDLFVTSTDVVGFPAENELFRNRGDGTFTKMTPASVGAIASLAAGGSEGGVWADYDNDGFLDMFVARYGVDWLYRNNGDGVYARITNNLAGLASQDSYFAVWSDYNNDGLPDLFVTVKSDPPTNRLYLNGGAGSFSQVTTGDIATDSAHSFGAAWGDYDNDGRLDLFVCNGAYVASETNFLYHNNPDGTFTRMTSNTVGTIVSDAQAFGDCAWGDYDNDGFLDLFVSTYSCCTDPSVNFLYHNNGNGTFTSVRTGSPVNDQGFAQACAWADYDNDGFLDLFVARAANVSAPCLLYRNNGNSNAWIRLKLVGTISNRSAIGAKVRAQAIIRGNPTWQLREINAGNGFAAGPLEAHFGLGDATNVSTLRIEWPSGTVQELHDLETNQVLTVTEPPRLTALPSVPSGSFQMALTSWAGLTFDLEMSSDLTTWTKWGSLTTTNRITPFEDANAASEGRRFYRVGHR